MLKKNLIFDQTDFALIFIQENYRIVKIIHGVSKRQFLNGSKIRSRKMALLQYFLTFLPHIKLHWCKKCNKDEVCPTLKDQQQAFSCRYIIYLLLSDQIWNYALHVRALGYDIRGMRCDTGGGIRLEWRSMKNDGLVWAAGAVLPEAGFQWLTRPHQ